MHADPDASQFVNWRENVNRFFIESPAPLERRFGKLTMKGCHFLKSKYHSLSTVFEGSGYHQLDRHSDEFLLSLKQIGANHVLEPVTHLKGSHYAGQICGTLWGVFFWRLSHVTFGESSSLELIWKNGFCGCGLCEIHIPDGVDRLPRDAGPEDSRVLKACLSAGHQVT